MANIVLRPRVHGFFFIFTLVFISLIWRLSGWKNYPFWVDEFSTASQARHIIEYGWRFYQYIWLTLEPNNLFTHLATAGLFNIFGESEKIARLPALIAGSLVPLIVFLLAKKFMPTVIAWGAGLLTATAYIQILWSLQARGYAIQQLWYVLGLLLLSNISTRWSMRVWLMLFGVLILSLFTHFSSVLFMGALLLSVTLHTQVWRRLHAAHFIALFVVAVFVIILSGLPKSIIQYLGSSFFGANNVGYYHSFLWREYGIVTLMGALGLLLLRKKSPLIVDTIILHILGILVFALFLYSHYMSKYITGIFPYLYMGMAYFLYQTGSLFSKKYAHLLGLILICVIIGNGYKFASKPKVYYSINRDFREISNIDYHQIYSIVQHRLSKNDGPIAMIDTWPDRLRWYLGPWYMPIYLFRWENEEGLANGHAKKTPFKVKATGEKYLEHGLGFVSEEKDVVMVMKKYPKGFLFIDDDTLPRDVLDYAEKNLKKEIFLDHYPLDDNPYSKWPATLYSWGFQ